MQRDKEVRFRLDTHEQEMVREFISRGKQQKIWRNNRTALLALIDFWNANHIKGKFIN